jgi:hypothetical protein
MRGSHTNRSDNLWLKNYLIGLATVLILLAMNAYVPPATGQTAVSPVGELKNSQALSQLEEKLFEHDYRTEDDNSRLKRLEDFVYGSSQSGAFSTRLANLQAVASAFKPHKSASLPKSVTESSAQSATPSAKDGSKSAQYSSFDYANYPRVAELEKHLLGSTYASDALPDRLARLETKAFGHPSTSGDLCQRVDLLDQYADRHDLYHERGVLDQANSVSPLAIASRSVAAAGNPFSGTQDEPSNPGERISAMEQMVFGHSYTSRSEDERLSRLEKKLVPWQHNLAQKDRKSRVDNLWNMLKVANTMNSSPLSKGASNLLASGTPRSVGTYDSDDTTNESAGAPAQPSSSRASWLHSLGRSLAAGSGQSGSMNTASPYSGSYGYPGAPGMGIGFNPGFWP